MWICFLIWTSVSYTFQVCPKHMAKTQISAIKSIGENYFSVVKYYKSDLESEASVQKEKESETLNAGKGITCCVKLQQSSFMTWTWMSYDLPNKLKEASKKLKPVSESVFPYDSSSSLEFSGYNQKEHRFLQQNREIFNSIHNKLAFQLQGVSFCCTRDSLLSTREVLS